jgi:hypothetical protein
MRRRMRPAERYVIAHSAGVASIRADSGAEYPLDGRPHAGTEEEQVTSRFTAGGEIQQSWRHSEESHGTTVWRLDGAGKRLVVSDRVLDSHFEQPIEYSTSYERVAAEP